MPLPVSSPDQAILNASIPGWMPPTELGWLGMLASHVPQGGRIMELGAWCGRSTFAIGMNRADGVPMTVVDTFLYGNGYRREHIRLDWLWGNHSRFDRYARIAEIAGSWYPCFLESTHEIRNMEVLSMNTRMLGKQSGVSMAFIDADHRGESPLQDIMLFIDDPECLIVMDDCYRQWSDVISAVMHVRDRMDRNVFLPKGIKLALIMPKTGPMLEPVSGMVGRSLAGTWS